MRSPRFARRTNWDFESGGLANAWSLCEQGPGPVFDLTISNPTTAGFSVDLAVAAIALADGIATPYLPLPFGLLSARQAVADYYKQDHAAEIDPARILLTVSTSEAYSFLFRLLCDAGDEVLLSQPSYPLFDFLAGLDDVLLRPVALFYDEGWHLDRAAVETAITPRTKAILLVHPNNPTGHFTTFEDREWLDNLCAGQNLAIIVDEVFLDYSLGAPAQSFLHGPSQAPTFVLSGLSKISGLPQMKLAWIATTGPTAIVEPALQRLDVIADTFLSISTPMQLALPALLDVRKQLQPQILARLRRNLATLDAMLAGQQLVSRLKVDGGWYATLRIPALEHSELAAIRLVSEAGVYVHPGSFFGFGFEGILVISLLTPEATFNDGISLLFSHIQNFE